MDRGGTVAAFESGQHSGDGRDLVLHVEARLISNIEFDEAIAQRGDDIGHQFLWFGVHAIIPLLQSRRRALRDGQDFRKVLLPQLRE